MTDADNTDELTFPSPASTESLQHNLEQATGSIGFYTKANKAEYVF